MSKCKHAIVSGGDYVPYGSSGAYLPETFECDNPAVPTHEEDELICSENCPYHEKAILDENEERLRRNKDLLDIYETRDFWVKVKETNDFLRSKGLI